MKKINLHTATRVYCGLFFMLCLLFLFYGCQKKTPIEELLLKYMAYIPKQDYEAMYGMIDIKASGSIKKDKFIERNSKIYEGIEISNLSVEVLEVNEKELKVRYKTTFDTLSDKITFENTAQFSKLEDNYKLIWKDSLIVPNLQATDAVNVLTNKAIRGQILDRNGYVLAGQGEAFSVGLVPEKMEPDNSITELADILNIDADIIRNKLDAKWVKPELFVPVKTLSAEEKEAVKEELLLIPGVMIKTQIVRTYPLGQAAAHLVGYIQNITAEEIEKYADEDYNTDSLIGKSGMEALYEKKLKGENGYTIRILDAEGKMKDVLTYNDVKHGEDVQLTIDSFLQQDLYETFKEEQSCSVALNPETGEVLALVSTPSYDNNDFILGMSTVKWEALNNDVEKPLLNRFRQTYTPGSTFKPITALIGLKNNAFTADEDFGSEGHEWQKKDSWGAYHVTTLKTYEPVVLKNAIMYSDNIYFAKVALKTGRNHFEKTLDVLGFNSQLPFEINMGKSKYSNTGHIETEIQLADSGYGQGQILMNPLHLATLYTAFVNQGNVLEPTLEYEKNYVPKVWLANTFSEKDINSVLEGIKLVVNNPNGTGYVAYNEGVVLAGKTGTAEIKSSKDDTDGTEIGWFIVTSIDDTEKPLLLLSMVEDVKNIGGSAYVAKKDAEILNEWFK